MPLHHSSADSPHWDLRQAARGRQQRRPTRDRPAADFKTFAVSGAGGFGSGTCPTTVNGQCRFYGTSAAAPSAAGVAALVRQANGGTTAPRNLNSLLAALAVQRAGFGYGAGVLRALH
jgi:subtilisin family serine protease